MNSINMNLKNYRLPYLNTWRTNTNKDVCIWPTNVNMEFLF